MVIPTSSIRKPSDFFLSMKKKPYRPDVRGDSSPTIRAL